jgi:PTH1 family peptidyl-tRNA hydrolase
MKLVVGLGNPGARYRRTRHNLGFRVVDRLAERWSVAVGGRRHETELGEGSYSAQRVVLAKPLTFMNLSGEAVTRLRRSYHCEPGDVIAVYDELDLPLGRIRVRRGGGPGGHRGVVSLIAAIGAEFSRIRIGIGRPPGGADPAEFVLEAFTPEEAARIDGIVDRAANAVESLIRDGLEKTMGEFNRVLADG